MRGYKVTVTSTVAPLVIADNKHRTIYINVVGNESIAIGNSTVSFAEGLLIAKHTTPQTIEVPQGEGIWAICDAGKTDDVRILMPDGD